MNGMNMNQFVLGFAIARPLQEQRDRFMVALAASMFPASNPYGAIFLKPQVDALSARESEVAALKSTVNTLQAQVTTAPELFKLPADGELRQGATEEFDLKVPGVTVTPASSAVEAKVDTATGKVTLTGKTPQDDVAIDIAAAGLTRRIERTVPSGTPEVAARRGPARSE